MKLFQNFLKVTSEKKVCGKIILMMKKMWQNEQLNHFIGMIQRAPHMLALVIPT